MTNSHELTQGRAILRPSGWSTRGSSFAPCGNLLPDTLFPSGLPSARSCRQGPPRSSVAPLGNPGKSWTFFSIFCSSFPFASAFPKNCANGDGAGQGRSLRPGMQGRFFSYCIEFLQSPYPLARVTVGRRSHEPDRSHCGVPSVRALRQRHGRPCRKSGISASNFLNTPTSRTDPLRLFRGLVHGFGGSSERYAAE